MQQILVATEDHSLAASFKEASKQLGATIEVVDYETCVTGKLGHRSFDLVAIDETVGGDSFDKLIDAVTKGGAAPEIVLVASNETIAEFVRRGCQTDFDYVVKPCGDVPTLVHRLGKLIERRKMLAKLEGRSMDTPYFEFDELIGASSSILKLRQRMKVLAQTDQHFLVCGEPGTGRELVARSVHFNSARRLNQFSSFRFSAAAERFVESELFGHTKNAFLGARQHKTGLIEATNSGTLFLREVADLSMPLQANLCEYLTTGKMNKVGGQKVEGVDVRLIAATSKDLESLVSAGRFREDLFKTLSAAIVYLSPLRDRIDDIELLTSHFLRKFSARYEKPGISFHPKVLKSFCDYTWPGNVKELENAVESMVAAATSGKEISTSLLPDHLCIAKQGSLASTRCDGLTYKEAKKRMVLHFSRNYIAGLLSKTSGNITHAASLAGMERSNFKKLMNQSYVSAEPFKRLAVETEKNYAKPQVTVYDNEQQQRSRLTATVKSRI